MRSERGLYGDRLVFGNRPPWQTRGVLTVDRSALRAVAMEAGADVVGFTSAGSFTEARDTLIARKDRGMGGPLHFTYDDPVTAADVRRTFPWANSLVVVGCSYVADASPPAPGGAVIGRFATRDHYRKVRLATGAVTDELRRRGGRADALVDDNRLLDRAAAARSGLGWIGRSTMALAPGHGPWLLLGSVATDIHIPGDPPMLRGCGTCVACVPACPTGAITPEGLDARRCISTWLQSPGSIPHWIRPHIGRRIYGCDDCLTSCPPGGPALARVTTRAEELAFVDLLEATDDELMERFHWWYVPRRDPRFLRRNVLVAAGNSGEKTALPSIVGHFDHRSSLIRGHAYWAYARSSGSVAAWTALIERHASETSPDAIAELERALLMLRVPRIG